MADDEGRTGAAVLVVEDDAKTADTVSLYLRHAGFRVTVAGDGTTARRLAATEPFDLLVVDRMLPGVDGVALCRTLRETSDVPVIMLTAMVQESDRLEGFSAGVDDYVTKPFSPRELVARVHAVLRRAAAQRERAGGTLRVGALTLDANSRDGWLGDRRLALSPTEFRVLHVLAGAPGRVFSRDELAERALPDRSNADLRTVDAHVKNLRRKLDPAVPPDTYIATVIGLGYRLDAGACRRA